MSNRYWGWGREDDELYVRLKKAILKVSIYSKVPKFLDAKKLCCNSPEIQTKRQNLKVFGQKHVNGIANSEDPDH